MTEHRDPAEIPWKKLGAQFVIEATGVFRNREPLLKHIQAGAEKVILTVPPKDEIDATIVMGVNDAQLKSEHRVVSNASCTTNCLAPIVKILDDSFGIEEGFITTVHAYTNDQRLADVPHKDFRRSVLPQLQGKLDGLAMRVPVPDGSIVDLVCRLNRPASRDDVNTTVREAAAGPMQKIVEYSEAPLVSSDIIGNPHSSIFDALSTKSESDGYIRILSWYDNEWGYSNRVVDLIEMMAAFG
jgi:glyceraldehyde 3-phosphate dehydrogenase